MRSTCTSWAGPRQKCQYRITPKLPPKPVNSDTIEISISWSKICLNFVKG